MTAEPRLGPAPARRLRPPGVGSTAAVGRARGTSRAGTASAPLGPRLPEKTHFERVMELVGGVPEYRVNQRPQACVTKGDITECRDAPTKR